jgi:hypothetical protein
VTFDATTVVEQKQGFLSITPHAHRFGMHFSGYVSTATFDLSTSSIATELGHPAPGGATTIFAAVVDSANWIGFRIEGAVLSIESHTGGKVASRSVPYDAAQHRFLRLRKSKLASVVVWETSADGRSWNPEYVETTPLELTALRIVLSAGTKKSIATRGAATFGSVTVESNP